MRRSIWLFPIGIAGNLGYFAVFDAKHLYASAALQIFIMGVQIYGWMFWSRRGNEGDVRPIRSLGRLRTLAIAGVVVLASLLVGAALARFTDASLPYRDGLIAGLSITAQILTARKVLQCWLFWIVPDILAILAYPSKDLIVTSSLYIAFLSMAIWGWFEWRRTWRLQQASTLNAVHPGESRDP